MPDSYPIIQRREALALVAAGMSALATGGCARTEDDVSPVASEETGPAAAEIETDDGDAMQVHYIEIVTDDVDSSCSLYTALHGVKFSDADPSLGGARTAKLSDKSMVGVRAPMHAGEKVVTRIYYLVEDIDASFAQVKESGADILVEPMDIPGHGKCAIYMQGGVEAGLWQV
ncbi:MAG: hypothetical protein Aurels2KO_45970 [Aureliella sp.]